MITDYNRFLNENKKVDELLDKISATGMKSLTPDEIVYLNRASQGDVDDNLENKINKKQNKVTLICTNFDIPDLEFEYERTDKTEDEIVHYGKINFNDIQYMGAIYCDENGDFVWCDFYSDDPEDELQDQMEGDLYINAEGYEDDIDHFLIDEVCPKLKRIDKIL
jgi:hypothetical protein